MLTKTVCDKPEVLLVKAGLFHMKSMWDVVLQAAYRIGSRVWD